MPLTPTEHSFNILNMSSVEEDVTARARIRDAALALFGRSGFERTTIRAIAAEAGVSPALVVHHFGSKARLREACDEHLLATIREGKSKALVGSQPPSLQAYLAGARDAKPLFDYVLRSLLEGGAAARRIFGGMVEDAAGYLEDAEAAGTVRASEDPRARAAVLTSWGLAALLLEPLLADALGEDPEGSGVLTRVAETSLEIYTHGLFVDTRFLDAFVAGSPTEREQEADR